MKKPLSLLICAFALILSGCSKEEIASPNDEKLYPVTFNVSTFSKQIVPMASLKTAKEINASTSSKTLSEAVQHLNYGVYNETGIKVNEKESSATNPGFGKIEDSLPQGRYTVVVLGTKRSRKILPSTLDEFYFLSHTSDGGDDVFFQQTVIEVKGAAINQSLQLSRKVGKVEIELSDKIPENIEEIVYTVKGVSSLFHLRSNYGAYDNSIYKSNYYWSYNDEMGAPDYSQDFGLYFLLSYDEDAVASVNVRAYDRNRNLVVDKTINDVPVGINKKTILTGRLFDDAGNSKGQAFSVSLDDKWNSNVNHINF